MENAFIGRQPIFDRDLNVYAYELLSRNGHTNSADIVDGDAATTNVIINALTEIGMETLVGSNLAFINLTRNFILGINEMSMPEFKQQIVLEILEDVEADTEIVSAVKKLNQSGYTIALDDFIYHESLQPLVDMADIIKIDLMALDESQLRAHVAKLGGGKCKLLAEKVETREEFELCKELGFEYFQGYFLSRPNVVEGKRPPANKLAIMNLLASLQDPDTDSETLAELISKDVTLSFRILRYINSAQFSLGREIDSIQDAIMMLGRNTILNLASLIAMSQIEDKPHELIITAMVRGKMAEILAKSTGIKTADSYFTCGLFSVMDAMMDQTMETVLQQLPLSSDVKSALLKGDGEIGGIISCVKAYEQADWNNAQLDGLDTDNIRNCYFEAINWATSSSPVMNQDA